MMEGTMEEIVAIRTLLFHLPEDFHGYWLCIDDLYEIFRNGGFPLLPRQDIRNALKGRDPRKWTEVVDGKDYYAFSLEGRIHFSSYKQQRETFKVSRKRIPTIAHGFFLVERYNYGATFLKAVNTLEANGYTGLLRKVSLESREPPTCNGRNHTFELPPPLTEEDDDFLQRLQDHGIVCRHRMVRVQSVGDGHLWYCNICHASLKQRRSSCSSSMVSASVGYDASTCADIFRNGSKLSDHLVADHALFRASAMSSSMEGQPQQQVH